MGMLSAVTEATRGMSSAWLQASLGPTGQMPEACRLWKCHGEQAGVLESRDCGADLARRRISSRDKSPASSSSLCIARVKSETSTRPAPHSTLQCTQIRVCARGLELLLQQPCAGWCTTCWLCQQMKEQVLPQAPITSHRWVPARQGCPPPGAPPRTCPRAGPSW